ncbi:MAG: Na/Pi cotransporter family protein [Gammaproteobacteria bacterium]|nr:Na/Pi cotransporter family protein [Gammaproteobacteria bacterium]
MNYSFTDFLTLLGSLGLFLYGMKIMSDSLIEVAGDKMRNILASMTSNRVFAVFTGFLITSVIQSSSATTLMVVSFVNASLLSLTESVGVIMGANIGTTVTAWLITILGFKVSMSTIALPLVALGFLLMLSKNAKTKSWGGFVVGFAVLFIGLDFLKSNVPNINDNPEILEWLKSYTDIGYLSVILFLLIGTILTVVIQSSSATMALTLVMTYEGWIPFDMAAAMVLGENIGTTITANLAALVANRNAKRTARAHLIFNLLGVIWMLIFFYPLLNGIEKLMLSQGSTSPFANALAVPVALSVFHTSFNVINTFVLIWFVPLIVKIVIKILPYGKLPELETEQPRFLNKLVLEIDQPTFLNNSVLKDPQLAINAMVEESKRMFEDPVFEIIAHVLNIHRDEIISDKKLKEIINTSTVGIDIDVDDIYYKRVKSIYNKTMEFATKSQDIFELSKKQVTDLKRVKMANRKMAEIIKDCHDLNNNMSLYSNSENKYMQKSYGKFRRQISKIMRIIHLADAGENPKLYLKILEKLEKKVAKDAVRIDVTLNLLIKDERITNDMATSLTNDRFHVEKISLKLITVGELLYIDSDTLLKDLKKGKKSRNGKNKNKSKKKNNNKNKTIKIKHLMLSTLNGIINLSKSVKTNTTNKPAVD